MLASFQFVYYLKASSSRGAKSARLEAIFSAKISIMDSLVSAPN